MPISNESKEALRKEIGRLKDIKVEKQKLLDIKTAEKQALRDEVDAINEQINKLQGDL